MNEDLVHPALSKSICDLLDRATSLSHSTQRYQGWPSAQAAAAVACCCCLLLLQDNLDTDPFVSAVGGNRLPEMVRKVTLKLDENILRYATLVDTPGLRDPDPKRRRVALDAITAMDGWIYLVAAGKAETGVISDLTEIREEADNMHGVVCISKVNLLNDPTATKSLDELASQQRAEFQRYSAMPITYDSAMARAQFALIRETTEGSEERFVLLRDILDQSYGFGFIRRLVPALRDRSFSDPLKQAFQGLVEKASGHGAATVSAAASEISPCALPPLPPALPLLCWLRLLRYSPRFDCLFCQNTEEFHMLEDVLTETSLLITTLRNIAELLQEKIVRQVAAERRSQLVGEVYGSQGKLKARETALVQIIGWMDEHDATQAQIIEHEKDFLNAKSVEEAAAQISGCINEQLTAKSDEQVGAAREAVAAMQTQLDGKVEAWCAAARLDHSPSIHLHVLCSCFRAHSLVNSLTWLICW